MAGMYRQPYIDNGNLLVPLNGGYIGIPLWFIIAAAAVIVGFVIVVMLAAMCSKRNEFSG